MWGNGMRKTAKFLCERKQRRWRHGGREVLCFQSELPDGESGAALHLACLSQRLCDYAERELVPLAAAALEEAVLAGRGYAFTPFTVRLFAQIRPLRGALCITLTLVEKRGARCASNRY